MTLYNLNPNPIEIDLDKLEHHLVGSTEGVFKSLIAIGALVPTEPKKEEVLQRTCGFDDGFSVCMRSNCKVHSTPQGNSGWEESLQVEVMEDYLNTAEAGVYDAVGMATMRKHWNKLCDFIRKVEKEAVLGERKRILQEINKLASIRTSKLDTTYFNHRTLTVLQDVESIINENV